MCRRAQCLLMAFRCGIFVLYRGIADSVKPPPESAAQTASLRS